MADEKWQRARVLKSAETAEAAGLEMWVSGPPEIRQGLHPEFLHEPVRCFMTNLLIGDDEMIVKAECLELLARSEADFADTVPTQQWHDWLKEKANEA